MQTTTRVTRHGEVFATRQETGSHHYLGELVHVGNAAWVALPKWGDTTAQAFTNKKAALDHLLSQWQ